MAFTGIVVSIVFLLVGTTAYAVSEKIGITQTRNREMLVSLSGITDDCGGRPAPPQLVRVGASVLITQGAVFPECTPPGPPTYRYDPYAYSYSINLGVLGDDTYSVEWRFFPIDGSPFLVQYQGNPYRTTFVVRAGSLVDPFAVPVNSPPWLLGTALLLAGVAVCGLRRRHLKRQGRVDTR